MITRISSQINVICTHKLTLSNGPLYVSRFKQQRNSGIDSQQQRICQVKIATLHLESCDSFIFLGLAVFMHEKNRKLAGEAWISAQSHRNSRIVHVGQFSLCLRRGMICMSGLCRHVLNT